MVETPTHHPDIDTVKGERGWSLLEQDLLDVCVLGHHAYLPGKVEVPVDCSDPDLRVRAGLIRYLMLGGCVADNGARPHPTGVMIVGGWIDGVLNLVGCESTLDLTLRKCLIPERPDLMDARINGLYLPGCVLPKGATLQRLKTRSSVQLNGGFRADEEVNFSGAEIGGQLACTGGLFLATDGRSLNCDAAKIGRDVFLSEGFRADAEVNFIGAVIGGQLACIGGLFLATGGRALNCNAAKIGADVFMSEGFRADAEVSFTGAVIGGQLACIGGQFLATGGRALNCDAAKIGRDVFLRDGFQAAAEVNFIGAVIGGQLDCTGGQFLATDGRALLCDTAKIGADVFLRNGFRADAEVSFTGAVIGGSLQIFKARFEGGISGTSMRVEHGFFWKGVSGGRKSVDLTDAHVGGLRDDWASWDGVGALILDGFRYDRVERSLTIAQRLEWLGKNWRSEVEPPKWVSDPATATDFDPQPYVQLAGVLRAQGDRAGAARVLVEREIKQRRAERQRAYVGLDGSWAAGVASVLEDLKRPVNLMFRLFFGYGHQPMRALAWVAGFVLFGAALFGAAYDAGQMAPNSDVILTSADWLRAVALFEAGGDLPQLTWAALPETQDYETFNRLIYGLDLFVPLDALGQENAWAPSPARGALGQWGFYLRPVIQAAGWIMTALGAAVLTGLVGRRD